MVKMRRKKAESARNKESVVLEFSVVNKGKMAIYESGDTKGGQVTQKLEGYIKKYGEFSWCNGKSLKIFKA